MAAYSVMPAAATTASEARCLDARGSGSLNEIRLHCDGAPGVAAPATMPGAVFSSMVSDGTIGSDMRDPSMSLRDMNCMQARNENSQANIAFFCS
jgi:hypothetical protein